MISDNEMEPSTSFASRRKEAEVWTMNISYPFLMPETREGRHQLSVPAPTPR
jgi:hypothetical protein